MRLLFTTAALALAAVALAACNKPAPEARSPLPSAVLAPVAGASAASAVAGAAAGAASDASVPAAETVLTPPPDIKVDPNAGRTNKAMTPTQESTAMPMPGQNNDHSAPLPAAKRASGP